jgi:hypothetical protein
MTAVRRHSPIRRSAGYGEFLIQSDRHPASVSAVKLRREHDRIASLHIDFIGSV